MVKEQPFLDFDEAQESRIAQYSLGVWPFDSKLLDRVVFTSSELTAHWKHEYFIRPNSPVSINKSIHVYTHYADKLLHPYFKYIESGFTEKLKKKDDEIAQA
ncbi:hypothetical protein F2Q69_00033168 [Brassica cretica]|uniref:Uncharacterized protein n=1 Tax=Brassica cretica TaxID=69181 RepID=A0A8S9SJ62_BRACR|nr:hypothetical protein F2Q69_00033168 [Brassica cretica]